MKKAFLILIILSSFGCGKETNRDRLGDAQICLDHVTSSNPDYADTCVAKIADVTTPAGDNLRCSAGFVKQGFTDATQLIATFNTISGGLNGTNIAAFLGLIIFDGRNAANISSAPGATTYYGVAKSNSTYCASAGHRVGTLITTFSFLGNAMIKLGCDGGCSCGTAFLNFSNADAICFGTYLTANSGPKDQFYSDLGTLVINSYLISCVGSTIDASLCANVSAAVTGTAGGTGNPKGVGKSFISKVTGISPLP